MHNFIAISNKLKIKLFKTVNFFTLSNLYLYILFINVLLCVVFFLI